MTGTKNLKQLYDIAVIGGGPTGSQAAFKLSQSGYRVVVLERKPTLRAPVCCTGIVSQECVKAYQIPDSVIYRRVNGASLYSPSGKVLTVNRDTPQAAILDRSAFNALWAKRAHSAGVEFLFKTEVNNLKHGKNNVTLEATGRDETITLNARAVIVATGFGARVMDGLGLGAAGDFVMGAQAEVETRDIESVEVYFGRKTAPGFFGWLVPIAENKALAGVLSRRHPPAYLRSMLSRLADEGKIISREIPFSYGGVSIRPLHRTYGDRLIVVGTAAGQVKPLTGGGIYFGLLCADIAANTLHRALAAGDLSPAQLAGYERAWKRKLGGELRTGYFARRVFELLSDSKLDGVFKLLDSSGLIRDMEKSKELSFDWHAAVVSRVFNHKVFMKLLKNMKPAFGLGKKV